MASLSGGRTRSLTTRIGVCLRARCVRVALPRCRRAARHGLDWRLLRRRDARVVLHYPQVRAARAAQVPLAGSGYADLVRVHRGLVQHPAPSLGARPDCAARVRKEARATLRGLRAEKRPPRIAQDRRPYSRMGSKSRGGEAKACRPRVLINRSVHPSTDPEEFQERAPGGCSLTQTVVPEMSPNYRRPSPSSVGYARLGCDASPCLCVFGRRFAGVVCVRSCVRIPLGTPVSARLAPTIDRWPASP